MLAATSAAGAEAKTAKFSLGPNSRVINDDGAVYSLPDYELAMAALAAPAEVAKLRLAKSLT